MNATEQTPEQFRWEHDSLGEIEVPKEAPLRRAAQRAMTNSRSPGGGCYADDPLDRQGQKKPALTATTSADSWMTNAEIHHGGLRRGHLRQAGFVVYHRLHPGRRRHVDQHERQRSDRQPGRAVGRPRDRRLRLYPSERSYQLRSVDQRRLPDCRPV